MLRFLIYVLSVCSNRDILLVCFLDDFFDLLDIIVLFNDLIINEIHSISHINHFFFNESIDMEDLMFYCFLKFMKILLHIIELIKFFLKHTVSNIHISFINYFYHSMLSIYGWFSAYVLRIIELPYQYHDDQNYFEKFILIQ